MNENPLTLYALNNVVRNAVADALPSRYWVVGELSEVRETAHGHCYIELVQRDEETGNIVAKARGTIWSRVYTLLRPYFLEQTGLRFAADIKVLLQVTVGFHELYGYALDVCDIEPTYTLGEAARRKQLVLNRLEQEGVINLNKELSFPLLPRRIAVISSSFATGYGDFCDQLANNPYGFVFYPALFASPMQGDKVEQGIISALNRIAQNVEQWDVVVIIRGGGATSDLSCFDKYDLANNCAQFPLPIITGIGHQRDDTVLDAVAHTRVKTPTAAAEILIHAMAVQAARIDNIRTNIVDGVRKAMSDARRRLQLVARSMPVATALFMQEHHHKLDMWQQLLQSASPENILAMGYTLTTCNGKPIRSVSDVGAGEIVVTHLADGSFESTVNKKNLNIKNNG
ncbi:MAG: exodeoxyribonuclease VII large subunit [Bacteroidaceae bacterium]|nr:exodeoxyribonuclease VII large subunit [Bacteroidaceae bacterium]